MPETDRAARYLTLTDYLAARYPGRAWRFVHLERLAAARYLAA